MLPVTLSSYIMNRFLLGFVGATFIFSFFTLCFDFLELNRRFGHYDVPLNDLAIVTALRLPYFMMKTTPFAILLGSLFAFFTLNRHGELIVARACGFSAWQFLVPITAISCLIGVVTFTILNPISATAYRISEEVKNRDLKREDIGTISISPVGLWLSDQQQSENNHPNLIHIRRIDGITHQLQEVTLFFFEEGYQLQRRIDAAAATMQDGYWALKDVHIMDSGDERPHRQETFDYRTTINFSLLQDNFLPPETVSFWNFSEFISVMEQTGFSSKEHRLHYYQLWLTPLLALATALLGVAFSLHAGRRPMRGIGWGLAAGFVLFQSSALLGNIALLGRLPLFVAAAMPPVIVIAISLLFIMREEDA